MQEEVTRGAVTLIVDGAKLSEQVFEKAVKKFLEEIQKSQKPKIYRGRQSLKQLASQNAGLANIEISDKNIKAFSRVAKKYHVDFALKKDTAAEQPRYLVFFKSRDADAITAAFQEFASRKMSREEKPSIRERLTQAKEQAAEKTEHRTIDREKVKVKDPHCHIMLTMRPLDERGAWAAKSKKEYDLDENGERIRLPSGRYKTHKAERNPRRGS